MRILAIQLNQPGDAILTTPALRWLMDQGHEVHALLQNAAAFVGVDSMPMHLAAALGKPGIALFGPTDEKIWGPWHSRLTVLRNDCRCLRESSRSCPTGPASQCLADLSAETVLEKLVQVLNNS